MRHKIAIIHDWLTVRGGAERVLERLLYLYPSADLFCLFGNQKIILEPVNKNRIFKTSFLQNIPYFHKLYRYCALAMPTAVENINLKSYDLIISSSWAFAHGIKRDKNTKHVAYVHSPMRWAWDMEDEYLSRSRIPKVAISNVRKQLSFLRKWDFKAAQNADVIISNSKFVKKRIMQNWCRDSTVIYPPVTITRENPEVKKNGSYISISRLVPYKRIDKIIRAFKLLPEKKLIVAGEGPERNRLEKISTENVNFVGALTDEKKFNLLGNSLAMIQASKEDFGISTVEAQACGVPVIAFFEGGASEIISHSNSRKTGMLFKNTNPEEIASAVNKFEKLDFFSEHCIKQASKFSCKHFDDKVVSLINKLVDQID